MNTPAKLSDKVQEIGYALIRVAAYVRRKDFRSRLEGLALTLVEAAAAPEPDAALATTAAIQNIVKLLASVYEIETVNASILLKELSHFDSAMRQSFGIDKLPNMSTLFSLGDTADDVAALPDSRVWKSDVGNSDAAIPFTDGFKETKVDIADDLFPASLPSSEQTLDKPRSGMVSVGSAIRQSAILSKIKLSCNDVVNDSGFKGCRMKDLIAEFPDVSERTLRYDLQRLLQHGSVERVGNGGPASYYVIK